MGKCQNCENDLVYIEEYSRSYCYFCQQYQDQITKPQPKLKQSQQNKLFEPAILRSRYHTLTIIISVIIVILLIIPVVSIFMSGSFLDHEVKEQEDNWREWPIHSSSGSEMGYSEEYSNNSIFFDITENYVTRVDINLNWQDEGSQYMNGINDPDAFNLSVYTSWDDIYYSNSNYNTGNGHGQISVEIEIPEEHIKNDATGEWKVEIFCCECGDDSSLFPVGGLRETPDTGNDWTLDYSYEYHSKERY